MNGILLINKPKEYTSHDIVAIVKRISREKVGHTGTLDPNATGVLPLLIGKATGISKYLVNHDKKYIATLKLGIKTDTADAQGKKIEEKEVPFLSESKIREALQKLVGKQEQIPPMYSAIKVKGKKLYEYAREGKVISVNSRTIEIYEIKLLEWNENQAELVYEVACSKGTYIRTLCETLAENLGTVGYLKELKRVQVGDFKIEDTIDITELKEKEELLEQKLISLENFFRNKEKIELEDNEYKQFLNGIQLKKNCPNDFYRIYHGKEFIGLGVVEEKKLKRDVIV